MDYVETMLTTNQKDILMEEIVARYHEHTQGAEVILIEGRYRPATTRMLSP